jgi:hypothetical protein
LPVISFAPVPLASGKSFDLIPSDLLTGFPKQMIFFDPLFLLFMIPTMILGFVAQAAVKSKFSRYY